MKTKWSFGVGAFGKDLVYSLVAGFILYYYNTLLGISGTFTGLMMMGARIFDALNDPIMGVVVEKTHTRFGKFRPWIFSGTLLNALILYAMFSIPTSVTGSSLLIWSSLLYVLWGVTYTMMDIPFWSMIPALTKPGQDREALSVVGRTAAAVGFAIPTVLTPLLVTLVAKSERAGFGVLAGGIALLFILCEVVCVLGIKEGARTKQETVSLKQMLGALLANDQAMVVVVAIILFNASLYLTNQLALYFFKFDLGQTQLYSLFGMIGGASQLLAMVSFPLLRKRWAMVPLLVRAVGVTSLGYLGLFLLATLGQTNVFLLGLSAFIIFLGFGVVTVQTTIFLADTVDYGEWKTGSRNESVVFSMQTFVVKLASAISVLVAGVGIDLIGLDVSGGIQTPSALFGLRILMTLVPIVGIVWSLLYFKKHYRLDESRNKEIAQALAQRKEAGA